MIREKIPNLLTIARFFLAALVIFFLSISGDSPNFYPANSNALCAALLFLITALTDYLDGHLSRKWRCTSEFGKKYDPLADKVLIVGTLICLMAKGKVLILVGVIMIVRDILMDFWLRRALVRRGLSPAAIKSAKWKTALQMVGLMVILFFCNDVTDVSYSSFFPPIDNWKK